MKWFLIYFPPEVVFSFTNMGKFKWMMGFFLGILILGITGVLVGGCKKKESSSATSEAEPSKIKVQHILIAFESTLPGQKIPRSKEEAEKLAQEVLKKAEDPKSDFEALVKEYSADRPPGIYEMTNFNAPADQGAFRRDQMVPAFGDVGFKLKVGEVGLAPFDPRTSPFGYHIIKRLN